MHWLSVNSDTMVTYTRERLYESQTEYDRLMDVEHKYEDFVAVQEQDVVQKPSLRFLDFSLEFQLNYDLLIEAPIGNQVNLVDSIAIAGGIYIILTTVTAYILSWFYPYFMQLFIIRNLFKVDNGANKKR